MRALITSLLICGRLASKQGHDHFFMRGANRISHLHEAQINKKATYSPIGFMIDSIFDATPTQGAQDSGGVTLSWWLWMIMIVVAVSTISFAIYSYVKYKRRQIYVDYSQNPEEGIPRVALNISEKYKLSSWKINADENLGAKNVLQEKKKNYHGDYIELKFTQVPGALATVMASESIKENEHAYFEVEIDDNPKNSDVMIGFCFDKEYSNNLELGKSVTSLAFHSATGSVEYGNKELFNCGINAVYGETLGIGMRWSDGRIWLSYNGKFLNPPARSDMKKTDDDDGPVALAMDPAEKKADEALKLRKIIVQNKKPLFPAISSNGPVKVNLNIGGQQFRMNQKELKHGLL